MAVPTLRIKASEIFLKNKEADSFIVLNQGGTSSGKTYSILQVLLTLALSETLHISVCSSTMPHLKKGALKDWIDILTTNEIYNEADHNKTDQVFKIGNSKVEFFSLDNPGKARGPRRDILYVNEVDLVHQITLQQLMLRTRVRVYLDFNPAPEFHYVYDEIQPRSDCTFIKSTYKDNPFIPRQTVQEIERLSGNDWQVYGLGNRGSLKGCIYTHWKTIDEIPDGCDVIYGLDFGFNVPSALVRVGIKENDIYVQQLIYEPLLTNSDLIRAMESLNIGRSVIYADAAEPQRIEEIYRAGYNIKSADKSPGSVKKGIDSIKARGLYITQDSPDLMKEIRNYKWMEDKNGQTLEDPVKSMDHALDAMRYPIHSHLTKPSGKYHIL
jgi:phage terminase large subunit